MPDIKFYCPSCGKKMGIDAKAAGLLVNCPDCKKEIKVPHESEPVPPTIHRPDAPPPRLPPAPSAAPALNKPSSAAPRPYMTRPVVPPRIQPPEHPAPVLPVIPPSAVDERLVRELNEAKAALDRQAESFQTLAAEHDALKKKLSASESGGGAVREEMDRLRSASAAAHAEMEARLAAALKETATWQSEKNTLNVQIEGLKKELQTIQAKTTRETQDSETLTAKIHELEKNLKVTTSAASHAAAARDVAEQNLKLLEKQVEEFQQRQSGIDAEREELQRDVRECEGRHKAAMEKVADLLKQHDQMIVVQETLKSEIGELKTERSGLMKHQQEAVSLNRAMADMQKQLAEMREQEKELISTIKAKEEIKPEKLPPPVAPVAPVSPEPARTEPWVYSDPFLKMKRWMYIYAGIAACSVIGSIMFVMLWPTFQKDGQSSTQWTASTSPHTSGIVAVIGEPVMVDEVDITFERIRIGPVRLISMLGAETMSDKPYFVMEIRLVNRSADREVMVMQAWRDGKLLDNRGRRLKPAFNNPVMLETVDGMIVDRILKPGEEAMDMMVFEWEENDAESFTFTVDPGFRKNTGPETTSQISLTVLNLSFNRNQVVVE